MTVVDHPILTESSVGSGSRQDFRPNSDEDLLAERRKPPGRIPVNRRAGPDGLRRAATKADGIGCRHVVAKLDDLSGNPRAKSTG